MFLFGHPGNQVPLCLDCNAKVQEVLDRQMENQERMLNYLTDEMDAMIGLPGLGPRFPPRPPRAVIRSGNITMHNINIDRSNIGVLNSGVIGSIDSAIGAIRSAGDSHAATLLKEFTEQLVALQNVDADTRNRLIELVSALASELTLPPPDRRKALIRTLLSGISEISQTVSSLSQLYAQFAPAFADLAR